MKPFLRKDVKSILFVLATINSLTALVCLLSAISIGFVLQKERQQE